VELFVMLAGTVASMAFLLLQDHLHRRQPVPAAAAV
jgi:hypothetical protein